MACLDKINWNHWRYCCRCCSKGMVCQMRKVYYTNLHVGDCKVTHVLGPSVTIQSSGYGSSECRIALPYLNGNPAIDLRVTMDDGLIEFVDVLSDEPSEHVLSAVSTVHCISPFPAHAASVGTCEGTTLPAYLDDL